MSESSPYKRGIVLLNDPAKARSRVKIEDEDGVRSFWLAWNMGGAGASKIYNAPDIGSQVNCLVDWRGEDGCILGARYSDKDKPPTSDGKLMKSLLEGGGDFTYNKGNGSLVLKLPGGLTIEGPEIKVKGNIDVTGSMKANGKPVDETHRHKDVMGGSGTSGPVS